MLPQSDALRLVVKQTDGVRVSVANTETVPYLCRGERWEQSQPSPGPYGRGLAVPHHKNGSPQGEKGESEAHFPRVMKMPAKLVQELLGHDDIEPTPG